MLKAKRIISIALSVLLLSSIGLGAYADSYDLAAGSVSVVSDGGGQTVSQVGGVSNYSDAAPVITQSGSAPTGNSVTLTGTAANPAQATLDGVNIEAASGSAGVTVNGSAELTLSGGNSVTGSDNHAGVEVGSGDSLVITGDGSLEANAGSGGVKGTGAGIGGASGEAGGSLTITGSVTVEATGNGSSTDATNGAKTAPCSAGIGGGSQGAGGSVTISGDASVTATGGGTANNSTTGSFTVGGAGIGAGGEGSSGGTVVITDNASVTAQGGYNGAGIGGASGSAAPSTGASLDISTTGTVTATGGAFGAGIGGGARADGGSVTVDNATVTATGGMGGAGIGGGGGGYYGGSASSSGVKGAGGAGGSLTVLGGLVTAQGGIGAAGVGGGSGAFRAASGSKPFQSIGGSGATVSVLGGRVLASGGAFAVGAGKGANAKWDAALGAVSFLASTAADAGTVDIQGGSGRIQADGSASASGLLASSVITTLFPAGSYDTIAKAGLFTWDPIPAAPDAPGGLPLPGAPVVIAPDGDGAADAGVLPEEVQIADNETPLAAPTGVWALMNFILTALTLITAIAFLVHSRSKETASGKLLPGLGLVPAVASVTVFMLTEDLSLQMALTDEWTLLMAGIALAELLLSFFGSRTGKKRGSTVRPAAENG